MIRTRTRPARRATATVAAAFIAVLSLTSCTPPRIEDGHGNLAPPGAGPPTWPAYGLSTWPIRGVQVGDVGMALGIDSLANCVTSLTLPSFGAGAPAEAPRTDIPPEWLEHETKEEAPRESLPPPILETEE